MLKQLHAKIKQVEAWQPTIEALCNKALQPRHWSKIKEVTGMPAEQVNFETADLETVLNYNVSDVLP